mgnify:CR=1 FL=1
MMSERILVNAEQCARLLTLGHQYSVVMQVAPGSWLVDSSRAALEALERDARLKAIRDPDFGKLRPPEVRYER